MDPEVILTCPYDKSHNIRKMRYSAHIVKCRENHPELAKALGVCTYNASHIVPKRELEIHEETCESRSLVTPLTEEEMTKMAQNASTWQSPPSEENWEEEASIVSTPFVLNEFGNYQPYSAHETTPLQSPPSATSLPRCYDHRINQRHEATNGHPTNHKSGKVNHWRPANTHDKWPRHPGRRRNNQQKQ